MSDKIVNTVPSEIEKVEAKIARLEEEPTRANLQAQAANIEARPDRLAGWRWAMNIPNLVGWNFITASQKRHYFLDGRSLCGRFSAACTPTGLR